MRLTQQICAGTYRELTGNELASNQHHLHAVKACFHYTTIPNDDYSGANVGRAKSDDDSLDLSWQNFLHSYMRAPRKTAATRA